jgi:hypothetical protein
VVTKPNGTAKLINLGLSCLVASRVTSEGIAAGIIFGLASEQALA